MADPRRFEVLADYIASKYPLDLRIADVAGNLGFLNAALRNKGFRSVVTIDPSWRFKGGLEGIAHEFVPEMAEDYDLIVALDPHNVTSLVLQAAVYAPSVVVPCCIKLDGNWRTLEGDLYQRFIEKPLIEAGVRFVSEPLGLTEHNRVYRTFIPRTVLPYIPKVQAHEDLREGNWN